jgi:hypothetical protein
MLNLHCFSNSKKRCFYYVAFYASVFTRLVAILTYAALRLIESNTWVSAPLINRLFRHKGVGKIPNTHLYFYSCRVPQQTVCCAQLIVSMNRNKTRLTCGAETRFASHEKFFSRLTALIIVCFQQSYFAVIHAE